jgi:excisionase family DNA binding protein
MDDKLAYSIEEAARALSVSERTFRGMVAREEIRVVRVGRRVVIPRDALAELLSGGVKQPVAV